jgi:hypothetical protein
MTNRWSGMSADTHAGCMGSDTREMDAREGRAQSDLDDLTSFDRGEHDLCRSIAQALLQEVHEAPRVVELARHRPRRNQPRLRRPKRAG